MTCFHPIAAYRTRDGSVVFSERSRNGDYVGDISLPCGMCVGCRVRRARDWTLRMRHEATCWENNCFVTLTYGRDKLPYRASLDHRDWQLFMKRLRWEQAEKEVRSDMLGPIRFYMCGEYGPENLRPHFHACLFNLDFADRRLEGRSKSGQLLYSSPMLEAVWGLGSVTVQDFTPATAGYVAGYVQKAGLGKEGKRRKYERTDPETGEVYMVAAEYSKMSTMPYIYNGVKMPAGIGARWFQKYKEDVIRGDYVVADGFKNQTPKYYDDLYSRCEGVDMDELRYQRWLAAVKRSADNTPERLATKERLLEAKMARKVREL